MAHSLRSGSEDLAVNFLTTYLVPTKKGPMIKEQLYEGTLPAACPSDPLCLAQEIWEDP